MMLPDPDGPSWDCLVLGCNAASDRAAQSWS